MWQMHNYSLYFSEAFDYRTIRVFPQYLFGLCSLEIRRYGERLAFVLDQVGGGRFTASRPTQFDAQALGLDGVAA